MKQSGVLNRLIGVISDVFSPIIPILTAAGVLKGLLSLVSVMGVLPTDSGTYEILHALADSFFYYLPVFLGFSGAKRFGANPYTGAFLALALLHPDLTARMTETSRLSFLGLPVLSVTYSSGILPVFMAVAFLGKVEGFFRKRLPELIRSFGVPLCSALVVFSVTLLVFGPIGSLVGEQLADFYQWLYAASPAAAGTFLGALAQPMVICGFHWSIFPICIENINLYGRDTLMAILAAGAYAQTGAVFAVMAKTKAANKKSICFSGGISALFGTTEPALFGANIPLKTPFLMGCLAAAVGGGVIGFGGGAATAFVFPSIVTIPVFLGEGFGFYMMGCAVSLVLGFVLTYLFLKQGLVDDEDAGLE